MEKLKRSAYRQPPTSGGLKNIEGGTLERFDTEMFSNFNTGVLEQYLEEKNRRDHRSTSNFNARKVILIILLIGVPFTLITQYVALRTGVMLSGAFYISYLIGLGLKWSPSEINIGAGAATAAEKTATGFVFTFPAIYILASWGVPAFEDYGGESGFTSIPLLLFIIMGSMITSFLGILIMASLRKMWIVEDPLPTPGFQGTVKLLQLSDSVRKGNRYDLRRSFKLILYSAACMMIFGIFRDLPVVKVNHELYGTSTRPLRDLLLNSIGMGSWIGSSGTIATPPSISRFSRPTFQISGLLFAVGWFLRLRGASILLAGSIFSWFVLIPMAVLIGLPVQVNIFPSYGTYLVGLDVLKYEYFSIFGLPETLSIADLAFRYYIIPISIGVVLGAGAIVIIKVLPNLFSDYISKLGEGSSAKDRSDTSPRRYDVSGKYIIPSVLTAFVIISVGFILMGILNPITALILGVILIPLTILLSLVSVKIIGEMGISPSSSLALILFFVILMIMGLFVRSTDREEMLLMVLISAMIFLCTMALSSDIIWDMKAGLYAGTSPYHLMKGQTIGIVIGLPAAGLFAMLLSGLVLSNPGWAPQAMIMTNMARWFLTENIPWTLVGLGVFIGIIAELLTGMGTAFAIGMFIPTYVPFGIFIGALGRNIWERRWLTRKARDQKWTEKEISLRTLDTYILMIGLIIGESLIGVITAVFMMVV